MTSFGKRLLLTLTSVPALFSLIYFFPQFHHLGFAILTLLAVFTGSYEIKGILFEKENNPLIPFWLTMALPAVQFIELIYFPQSPLLIVTLMILFTIGFTKEIFIGGRDGFASTIDRISRTVFLIIYPGFFSVFLIRLLMFEQSTLLLLMLFLLVFGNDTFAYIFGMWLGKSNRNIFTVSPNKSLAGFIGGIASSITIAVLWISFIPAMARMFNIIEGIALGLVVSIISNIGDLIESALKRGANVKDSGTIIMGRGGIMDSIDSLLISAPFFLILIELLS
jgi:phosphatidate cytidylyltransferase